MLKIFTYLFIVCTSPIFSQDCTQIFISEYVEGTGNDKAIEIYNPTPNTINLSEYSISRAANGSSDLILGGTLNLTGEIEPLSTFVIVNGQTVSQGNSPAVSQELLDLADQLDGIFPAPTYFTGNDALVLMKNGIIIDIFGKIGDDAMQTSEGWSDTFPFDGSSGAIWTKNQTLLRKAGVLKGITNNPSLFNVTEEWNLLPNDTWSNLGTHQCNCGNTYSSISLSACNSYTDENNHSYEQSGIYTVIIPNSSGSDSIITLNLTIFNSSESLETVVSCEEYTWQGTTYTSSGQYYTTFTNAAGCDSIATLNLTISGFPNVSLPILEQVCDTLDTFPLSGGSPVGGNYSGTSIFNNNFNPSIGLGNYPVTYSFTDANGCSAAASGSIQVIECINTATLQEENTKEKLIIYPNPSSSVITLILPIELLHEKLCIYSVSGQKIHQQNISDQSEKINVSCFSKGIYMIEIGNYKQKFVVE